MRRLRPLPILILSLAIAFGAPVFAQEAALGANVDSLINYAKTRNPEYAAMQAEAEASGERVTPAGALPDPKFRTELRDITRFGEQKRNLVPESRRQHPLPADAGYSLVWQARPEARDCRA
jgi:cobalt-zinc-cadmium efflux system outer membrane protein